MMKLVSPFRRISRSDFWITVVGIFAAWCIAALMVMSTDEVVNTLGFLLAALFGWVSIAQQVNRIRDTGCSGWFYFVFLLISVIPAVGFVLQIIWLCLPTDYFTNRKARKAAKVRK